VVVVVVTPVLVEVTVDDVDDGGDAEVVQAASNTVMVTVANTPSFRTMIILSPITISGASGTGVRRSRLTWTIRSV
jgi:hypothetical protein